MTSFKSLFFVVLVVFASQLGSSNGANILVYIGMGSYSHRVPIQPYIDALAEKGHKITFLSGFPPKSPNPKIKEINPKKLMEFTESLFIEENFDVFQFRKNSQIIQAWFVLAHLGHLACESLYADEEFVKWFMDPETKFDIVVMDALANECAYGFVHHFKAKLIAFNTGQMYAWNLESHYGIPDETSSISDGALHLSQEMNFFERSLNSLMPLVWKMYRELWQFPRLEALTMKSLNLTDIPKFSEIETNTSLYLLNSHWAMEYARSLPPHVIPIGGITYRGDEAKGKPLPKKLEDFIQKGKQGFIYVSFGTVAEFTKFDPEVREAFINMTLKFTQIQFIWKSTHPILDKLPSNVLVEKWLPQADILVHPKIRIFVTHGGLGGIYEAIYSKVPLICFPIFAEQEYNANIMVQKGFAIKLELTTVTEKELTDSIGKILGDSSYKERVTKISKIFTDRPINPRDLAVYWTEFILKHGQEAIELLRPLSAGQAWWVRRQLDAWAFIFLVTIILLSIPLMILRKILKRLCGSNKKSKTKVKKN